MRCRWLALAWIGSMILSASACGSASTTQNTVPAQSYTELAVGETALDVKADLKVLTNRTDLMDTNLAEYTRKFEEMYPNVTITYEGITNYDSDMTTRLTSGDWGDICCIPATVDKSELSRYFERLADYDELKDSYEFVSEKMYDNSVYGIPSMGNVSGIVYNKSVFEKAGITKLPADPEAFLDSLQMIADHTDAIPLYTNYAAGWTLTAWDSYITGCATGDADFKNIGLVHTKYPFSERADMTGPYAVYQVLYEAVARGLTEEDPTTTDWEGCKAQINAGDIGCMVLGSWAVPQMQAGGPNPEDIAYMPFPITVNGEQYAFVGADYCYGVNVNSSADEKTAAMLYIKWLTESSGYAASQSGVPVVKGEPYPESLQSFSDVTLVPDNPAVKGEEDLFSRINNASEISLESDSTHVAEIVEAAVSGSKSMNEIADEWNAAWTAAQESNGVTPE